MPDPKRPIAELVERERAEIASWRRVTERLEREKRELRDARASFRQECDEARAECARLARLQVETYSIAERFENLAYSSVGILEDAQKFASEDQSRIATLEEALGFYADPDHYERECAHLAHQPEQAFPVMCDHGKRAREALAKP